MKTTIHAAMSVDGVVAGILVPSTHIAAASATGRARLFLYREQCT